MNLYSRPRWKQGAFAVIAGLWLLIPGPAHAADPGPAHAADPSAALDVAMAQHGQVPAMGMAILGDGHLSALAVRGVRVIGGHDAVLPGDPWHIGSDVKAMTAVLIARLVDRGVLHWDDPLGALMPDLAMPPRYARATLAQVMSHHAGCRMI